MVVGVGKSAPYCAHSDRPGAGSDALEWTCGWMMVPHFTLNTHCVMHMHHGKSLGVSIVDLGDVHGGWGR